MGVCRMGRAHDLNYPCIFAIANWIIVDGRICQTHPHCLCPLPVFIYAVEKWKAVKMYDQYRQTSWFTAFAPNATSLKPYLGKEKQSLYLSQRARDMTAEFDDGMPEMVRASQVQGKSLTELLIFVGRFSLLHTGYNQRLRNSQKRKSAHSDKDSRGRKRVNRGLPLAATRTGSEADATRSRHLPTKRDLPSAFTRLMDNYTGFLFLDEPRSLPCSEHELSEMLEKWGQLKRRVEAWLRRVSR